MSGLRDRRAASSGHALTVLSVVLVVLLGSPQVWAELTSGRGLGLASVFFPVLALALGSRAVSRRPR